VLSRKFILSLTILSFLVGFTSFVSFTYLNLEIDFSYYYPIIFSCALLCLCAFIYRKRSLKISNTAICAFWAILFTNIHIIPMFVIARLGNPLKDQILANYDESLGIKITDIILLADQYPFIKSFLASAYDSLIFLLTLALVLPPILGRNRYITHFFSSLIISTFIGFILFYYYQAEGPWLHYGYEPQLNQNLFNKTYTDLRVSPFYVIDPSYGNGLVCFPSFHTILAIISAYALTSIPWIKWIAYFQSLSIILGTLSTGTHYIIDVLVGIVIAFSSILISEIMFKNQIDSKNLSVDKVQN